MQNKSWAFEEAQKIYDHIGGRVPEKGYVLFETGYGPSGLPHIGTFGEVVRTCFVINAFKQIAPHIPTKLICISDDFDGLRKVPENIPNREMVAQYIGFPLTAIPDPFGETKSYGQYMNAKLCQFLDKFNFDYEFISATDKYQSGKFNNTLLKVIEKYDDLMSLMLANLGEDRQETYSPIMPRCPKTGKILATGVKSVNKEKGTVTYTNEFGEEVEQEVTNGNCKLQWKIDFGARWYSLGVDYEIFGKDHAPNEKIYRKVCEILGGKPPVNFWYELFLGEDGAKISKSKGNGISVDDWLKYAPKESLGLFMFQKPKTAKRLYFDVIPKCVDEYIKYVEEYHKEEGIIKKQDNPVYSIHFGHVPHLNLGGITFSLLLNLVSACNPENDSILWGFISKYSAELQKGKDAFVDKIVECSIAYYNNFVLPNKQYRQATEQEKLALIKVLELLQSNLNVTAEEIQNHFYSIGMEMNFELRDWFKAVYQILLGQDQGPRVGSFVALYGVVNFINLAQSRL